MFLIYTSYYGKAKNLPKDKYALISISVGTPGWGHAEFHLPEFKPTREMVNRSKVGDHDFYWSKFNAMLEALNPKEEAKKIEKMVDKRIPVLLCWEKDRNECHRPKVGLFLEQAEGVKVSEL